eukprot:1034008-Amphidinium_carterae.6
MITRTHFSEQGIVTTSEFYDPQYMKDYLSDTAEKYNDNDRQSNNIADHSMIRIFATYHKEPLYKLMKEAKLRTTT